MRKTAKILSILLTLALLCGIMVSVVASAEEALTLESYQSLSVSGSDKNANWDYSDQTDGYLGVFEASSTTTRVGDENVSLSGAKYFTVDFDFGTDKYLLYNAETGKYDTYSDVKPESDYNESGVKTWIPAYGYNSASTRTSSSKPNDSSNKRFGFEVHYTSSGYFSRFLYIGYETNTNRYYLFHTSSTASDGKYYLPDAVGEFTHITSVYELGADGKVASEHIYINGEYFHTYTVGKGTAIYGIYFRTPATGETSTNYYSYAIDNVAYNVYGSDYSTDDTVYGLDDLIAKAPATDKGPIYDCEDVLYNVKYDFSQNESLVVKDSEGNVKLSTDVAPAVIGDILNYVADGDTITTPVDILNFNPDPEKIDSFTVVLKNGATFTLAEGSVFEDPDKDGTYTKPVPASITVDGVEYTDFAAGIAALTDGGVITTSYSLTDVQIPAGVNSFTVVCNDGATFTLAEGAGFAEPVVDGNSYTYTRPSITVDGTVYYDFAAGIAEIKEDSVLTISADLLNVNVPAGVKVFTVICQNGATFSAPNYQLVAEAGGEENAYTAILTKLSVSGSDKNAYWDFNTPLTGNLNSSLSNDKGTWSYISSAGRKSNTTNGYLHLSRNDDSTSTSSATYSYLTLGQSLAGVKYYTVDYDFGTDKYIYDNDGDGVFESYSDTPVEGKECIPAYPYNSANNRKSSDPPQNDSSNRQFYIQMQYGGNSDYVARIYIGRDSDTQAPYLYCCAGTGGTDEYKKYYLPNEVGAFTHITMLYEVDEANSTLTEHIYINGEHFWSASETVTALTANILYIRNYNHRNGNNKTLQYSFAFDNLAFNFYENDVFGEEYDFESALYNNSNALYNKDTYVTPNYDKYITVNGNKTYIINAGLDAIDAMTGSENSVTTSVDVDFKPSNDLTGFALTLLNGAKFNVQNAAFGFFAGENANEYSVVKVKSADAYMALFGDMTFNLVVNTGVDFIDVDGKDDVTFNGNVISWTPKLESFDSNPITIYYGENVSTTITLDMLRYATIVQGQSECGSEASKLVYQMMQYKAYAARYAEVSTPDAYQEFRALHVAEGEDECSCANSQQIGTASLGQTKPEGVGIQYLGSLENIGIVISGVEAGTEVSVSFTYNYKGVSTTTSFEVVVENGDYIVTVPAAFIHQTLQFNIGGVEFDYSMQQYYSNMAAELSADAKEFIRAMYRYSLAAFDYKYTTSDEVTPAE